jgi:hypothetical protein
MNITTVVFAHGDALDTVRRHLPIWKSYTDNLIIVSPHDNPCIVSGISCITYEGRQHHGQLSLKRQLFAMRAATLYDSEYYVFLEYDAILLRRPDYRKVIQGNLWNEKYFLETDVQKLDAGKCFLHFPWIFPKKELLKFLKVIVLDSDDETPQDIWLLRKLSQHKFKVHNLMGFTSDKWNGYSVNSINTSKHINEVVDFIKNYGTYAIHGVKTPEVLNLILRASNKTEFL